MEIIYPCRVFIANRFSLSDFSAVPLLIAFILGAGLFAWSLKNKFQKNDQIVFGLFLAVY